MSYPLTRTRRLRRTAGLRDLVRETKLTTADLVYPMFVVEGLASRRPIESLPGVDHLSVGDVEAEVAQAVELGINSVMLFGLPESKDDRGSSSWEDDGAVQLAIGAIKRSFPAVTVISDVCLCGYTSHGHCGVLREDDEVDNDASLEILTEMAISHARAGVDVVAPSDMMDGRVGAIRVGLDEQGFSDTAIMVHSAKYASHFYGPFRGAANSAAQFGNRRSYQMDPANAREAVREVELDLVEGADIVMIKPALPYLDVIRMVRDAVKVPVAAYQVSGEYGMLKLAASEGMIEERDAVLESLTAIKRAGADIIVTYYAKEAAAWLENRKNSLA